MTDRVGERIALSPPGGTSEVVRIRATSGWRAIDLAEFSRYRELLWFLTARDVMLRYKQTALGVGWAVAQPILTMAVFSILFGRFGKLPSGGVPYPLLTLTALIPWQLFSYALTQASNSLVAEQRLISKVYFPRLIVPVASVLAGLVDLAIAFVLLMLMLGLYGVRGWYRVQLSWPLAMLPLFIVFALMAALAVGLWLAALNVQYRDIRYALPFMTQIWMFVTPVGYSSAMVPDRWRVVYGLNPMAGVIEGFRWAMLGTATPDWRMMEVEIPRLEPLSLRRRVIRRVLAAVNRSKHEHVMRIDDSRIFLALPPHAARDWPGILELSQAISGGEMTMFRLARRAAGRVRRGLKQRFSPPAPPPRSPWEKEENVFRRIVALAPEVVLDVGANTGQFVDKLRKAGYSGRVISFEPEAQPFEVVRKRVETEPEWECHRLALGDVEAMVDMHVSQFSPSSSLLPLGKLHVDLMPQTAEVGVERVRVVRLDQWSEVTRLAGRRLFLKLDVQGYELPVLRGMGGLLSQVDGALVELDFSPLFDGQSKCHEVMGALEAAGLHFLGLTGVELHPKSADFLWGDAFFVRQTSEPPLT